MKKIVYSILGSILYGAYIIGCGPAHSTAEAARKELESQIFFNFTKLCAHNQFNEALNLCKNPALQEYIKNPSHGDEVWGLLCALHGKDEVFVIIELLKLFPVKEITFDRLTNLVEKKRNKWLLDTLITLDEKGILNVAWLRYNEEKNCSEHFIYHLLNPGRFCKEIAPGDFKALVSHQKECDKYIKFIFPACYECVGPLISSLIRKGAPEASVGIHFIGLSESEVLWFKDLTIFMNDFFNTTMSNHKKSVEYKNALEPFRLYLQYAKNLYSPIIEEYRELLTREDIETLEAAEISRCIYDMNHRSQVIQRELMFLQNRENMKKIQEAQVAKKEREARAAEDTLRIERKRIEEEARLASIAAEKKKLEEYRALVLVEQEARSKQVIENAEVLKQEREALEASRKEKRRVAALAEAETLTLKKSAKEKEIVEAALEHVHVDQQKAREALALEEETERQRLSSGIEAQRHLEEQQKQRKSVAMIVGAERRALAAAVGETEVMRRMEEQRVSVQMMVQQHQEALEKERLEVERSAAAAVATETKEKKHCAEGQIVMGQQRKVAAAIVQQHQMMLHQRRLEQRERESRAFFQLLQDFDSGKVVQ